MSEARVEGDDDLPMTREERLPSHGATEEVVKRCRNGHEITPENTLIVSTTGRRKCRACANAARKRFEAKRKRGRMSDRYSLDDLDYAILAALPNEGTKIGKYLPDGRTSVQLHKELDDAYVTPGGVAKRLTALRDRGYVVAAPGAPKRGASWQRTKNGADLLRKEGA